MSSTPISTRIVDLHSAAIDELDDAAEDLGRSRLHPGATERLVAAARAAVDTGRGVVRAARGEE